MTRGNLFIPSKLWLRRFKILNTFKLYHVLNKVQIILIKLGNIPKTPNTISRFITKVSLILRVRYQVYKLMALTAELT